MDNNLNEILEGMGSNARGELMTIVKEIKDDTLQLLFDSLVSAGMPRSASIAYVKVVCAVALIEIEEESK